MATDTLASMKRRNGSKFNSFVLGSQHWDILQYLKRLLTGKQKLCLVLISESEWVLEAIKPSLSAVLISLVGDFWPLKWKEMNRRDLLCWRIDQTRPATLLILPLQGIDKALTRPYNLRLTQIDFDIMRDILAQSYQNLQFIQSYWHFANWFRELLHMLLYFLKVISIKQKHAQDPFKKRNKN